MPLFIPLKKTNKKHSYSEAICFRSHVRRGEQHVPPLSAHRLSQCERDEVKRQTVEKQHVQATTGTLEVSPQL